MVPVVHLGLREIVRIESNGHVTYGVT